MIRDLTKAIQSGKNGVIDFAKKSGGEMFDDLMPKQAMAGLKNLGFKSRKFDGTDQEFDPTNPKDNVEAAMGITEIGDKMHEKGKQTGKNPGAIDKADPLSKNSDSLISSLTDNIPGGPKALDRVSEVMDKVGKQMPGGTNPIAKVMGNLVKKGMEGFNKTRNGDKKDPDKGPEAKKGRNTNDREMDEAADMVKDAVGVAVKAVKVGVQIASNFLLPGSGIAASLAQKGLAAGMKGISGIAGGGSAGGSFEVLKKLTKGVKVAANKGMQTGREMEQENNDRNRQDIQAGNL